jgi:hypothetical protein
MVPRGDPEIIGKLVSLGPAIGPVAQPELRFQAVMEVQVLPGPPRIPQLTERTTMNKVIAVVGTMVLFASICLGKDVVVEPTTPTKTDTLIQTEPAFGLTFGLMEKNLDSGSFKSLKNKVPSIFNTTNGPTCGCSGPHDCCQNTVCVKSCR